MADEEDVTDDEPEDTDAASSDEADSQSFRDRVEEMRESGGADEDEGERPDSPFGGGGPGMGGMGGGNPMAQMMGGMMGGGPGGPAGGTQGGNEELVREIGKVRDELHDIRRQLERIGDELED